MTQETQETQVKQLENDAAALEALNLRLSWISRRRLQQDLEAFGLTVPQFMAMRCIQDSQQGCTMSELAESSHQVGATMTGIVDRLVDRELVNRTRDPNDRRTLIVALTPAGRELMDKILQAKRNHSKSILASLTTEERRALIEMTQRYLEVMENTVRPS